MDDGWMGGWLGGWIGGLPCDLRSFVQKNILEYKECR